jgi:hypothetical protein
MVYLNVLFSDNAGAILVWCLDIQLSVSYYFKLMYFSGI